MVFYSKHSYRITFLSLPLVKEAKTQVYMHTTPMYWYGSHNVNTQTSKYAHAHTDNLHIHVISLFQNDQWKIPRPGSFKQGRRNYLMLPSTEKCTKSIITQICTCEIWKAQTITVCDACILYTFVPGSFSVTAHEHETLGGATMQKHLCDQHAYDCALIIVNCCTPCLCCFDGPYHLFWIARFAE